MLNEEIYTYTRGKQVGGQLGSMVTAVGTEPLALGFRRQMNAVEMKPFDDTDAAVTQNHRAIRRLETSTENNQYSLDRFAYLRA